MGRTKSTPFFVRPPRRLDNNNTDLLVEDNPRNHSSNSDNNNETTTSRTIILGRWNHEEESRRNETSSSSSTTPRWIEERMAMELLIRGDSDDDDDDDDDKGKVEDIGVVHGKDKNDDDDNRHRRRRRPSSSKQNWPTTTTTTKKKKNKGKTVRFFCTSRSNLNDPPNKRGNDDDENVDIVTTVMIPKHPEIRIVRENAVPNNNTGVVAIYQYLDTSSSSSPDPLQQQWLLLHEYHPPPSSSLSAPSSSFVFRHHIVREVAEDDSRNSTHHSMVVNETTDAAAVVVIPLQSRQAVQEALPLLFRFMMNPTQNENRDTMMDDDNHEHSNNHNNNNIYYDEEFRHALLESVVQHQTMRLEMMIQHHHSENPRIKHDRKEEDQQHDNTGIPCSITIRIYLTRHAMTLSQSIGRPSASNHRMLRNRNGTSKAAARHSYEILLARFLSPNNTTNNTRDDDNNNNNHGSKSDLSSTINTAKHVYALTDNVQLQKSLLRQSSSLLLPDSTIPGLVPTLRGYQQHAVSWMLQRETTTTVPTDDEWQIAWSVLQFQEDENQKQSSRQLKAIPLYQYLAHTTKTDTEQKQIHLDSSTSNILLYSPILGWWADSVTMAKALTVSSPSIRRRGGSGILAESMGLGKTVEVLACILANPKPQSASSTTTMLSFPFSTTSNTETAKRRLEFGDIDDDDDDDGRSINCPTTDDPNPDPEESNKDVKPIQQATVGMVRDMEEFGDAEDEESSGKEEESSVCSALMMGDDGEAAERKDIDSHAALVTPGKEDRHCPQRSVEIRWVDEDILGTCICGDIIGFSTHKSKNDKSADAIVICHSCQEPMHTRCCCFGTFHKEANDCHYSQWLEYRQTYSNLSLSCRLVDERFCPCCFGSRNSGNIPSVESRATLIITPPAILNQWEREIFRHTTSRSRNIFNNESCSRLRVVIYEGIQTIISQQQRCRSKEQRSRSMELLHPLRLADADIVLMTFDALMRDLGHSDENRFVVAQQEQQDRAYLRKRKKYRVVPSPLLSVHWWRVCLDEAQRVENVTGAAKMACKLSTVHRWCVSGTPVGRGKLEDLYGLLLFLRLEPFDNKIWFRKCFLDSSIDLSSFLGNVDSRISHLLSNLFWRSTKKFDLVREQMGIPEQVEKKIVLQFSSIEKHFYDRQLEHAMSAAGDLVDKRGRTKKGKSCLNLLNEHLYRLRAACCHPQVGTGGIGAVKKLKSSRAAAFPRNVSGNKDAGVGSRVMTMSQILDKFIDDAKLQCEEALRLVVLHTNAMAALSKLKVEAKTRNDINIPESDQALLEQSCNLYLESLRLSDENAVPTLVTGEANLSGSIGFRMPHQVVNTCLIKADWKFAGVVSCTQEPWFKCDFTLGPARKITQLRLRSITKVPLDVLQEASEYNYSWQVVQAKECVFQCASLGGEYVDVHTFTMPCWQGSRNIERDWVVEGGFRTNKSKSWRLVVKSLHTRENEVEKQGDENFYGTYLGMDVEFFEATIASDPLQRLHCLHNASLSFSSLLQLQETGNFDQDASDLRCTPIKTRQKIDVMTKEAEKIESLYLDAARAMHNSFRCRLTDVSNIRKKCEQNLFSLASNQGRNSPSDCWDDEWWDDFLSICVMNGAETGQQEVVQRLLNDIEGVVRSGLHAEHVERNEVPFAVFHDIHGLQLAFKMRMQSIRLGLGNKRTQRKTAFLDEGQSQGQREGRFRRASGAHGQCIASIAQLSPYPSSAEMVENSHCKICKADWFQTGPKCRHCIVGDVLAELRPDRVTVLVLRSLYSIVKSKLGTLILRAAKTTANVERRAELFLDVLDAEEREIVCAWRLWRAHLDLLNDIDELNQCKTAMRLTFRGEDISKLTEDQLNAIVIPTELQARFYDHSAKQAMALGTLSRSKGTLQFLKNQSASEQSSQSTNHSESGKKDDACVVCLEPLLDADWAVLRCGHSFHHSCLQMIQSRSGGKQNSIHCPLRCRQFTSPKDVLIASQKRRDDGSRSQRVVKGSYGTKVTRLISDVLDCSDKGEKSIVFSQWDDMLDICEEALRENNLNYVRVKCLPKVGEVVHRFRSPDCSVMLLNVKNSAEGLTLVEATHVFMVEPLLNCGLDIQAINRVHRIGQNRKTYVWRYLIKDTIEIKIDKIRMEHQEDQLEDAISEGRKLCIKAGGIDGGFRSQEELMDILNP